MSTSVLALVLLSLVACTSVTAVRPTESLSLTDNLAVLKTEQGQAFLSWAKQAGKLTTASTYLSNPKELVKRFETFQTNVAYINKHNSENHSYKLALNEYADLTAEEFKSTRLGLKPSTTGTFRGQAPSPFGYDNTTAPASVNWVEKGAVTPVKNQWACGSCWAFSTTGSVEGANFLTTGELVSLSEQELVDCDTKEDLGCGGGLMDNAFEFIIGNGGIDTEADYGYWSFGLPCNGLREKRNVVTIDGYADVPADDETALTKAIANQPVSVAICADPLQFYSSGIVDSKHCCEALDHGVLAVGYGEEKGQPYYLVKNSWGAGWGEEGYFRLARDVGGKGTCAIANAASYPIKHSPNPKDVIDVCGWFGWSECEAGHKCSCRMGLPGFGDLLCLSWGCATRSD